MLVDSSIKPEIPSWLGQDATELSTGTTLVAMAYKDGVVLAADSRTSTGTFVAVRVTDKLTPVTSHIMVCRSGSAADTQAMTDAVKNQLEWYEIEFGQPPPVHTAAHLFKNIGYEYRDQFSAGLIVGGWDKEKGGQVYSVWGFPFQVFGWNSLVSHFFFILGPHWRCIGETKCQHWWFW